MATLYTVAISVTRNHDGSDYNVDWVTLHLVDGEAEMDRWSMLKNVAGVSKWPEVGDWSRSPAAGTVDLFTNDFAQHLARLAMDSWPWKRSTEGDVEFVQMEGWSKRGHYRVLSVE